MAVFPQHLRDRLAIDRGVHRALEQDCANDLFRCEIIRQNDPRAHIVHGLKHRRIAVVILWHNTIKAKRLGRRATRLIEGRDKAFSGFHLSFLCGVEWHMRSHIFEIDSVFSGFT